MTIAFTEVAEQVRAVLAAVVFVQRGDSGWAVATVARYHDTFRNTDGTWALAQRSMEFVG